MYTAKQDFKSYQLGDVKKGQEVPKNQAWLDEGLIEEKPEPEKKVETKPQPKKKKATK